MDSDWGGLGALEIDAAALEGGGSSSVRAGPSQGCVVGPASPQAQFGFERKLEALGDLGFLASPCFDGSASRSTAPITSVQNMWGSELAEHDSSLHGSALDPFELHGPGQSRHAQSAALCDNREVRPTPATAGCLDGGAKVASNSGAFTDMWACSSHVPSRNQSASDMFSSSASASTPMQIDRREKRPISAVSGDVDIVKDSFLDSDSFHDMWGPAPDTSRIPTSMQDPLSCLASQGMSQSSIAPAPLQMDVSEAQAALGSRESEAPSDEAAHIRIDADNLVQSPMQIHSHEAPVSAVVASGHQPTSSAAPDSFTDMWGSLPDPPLSPGSTGNESPASRASQLLGHSQGVPADGKEHVVHADGSRTGSGKAQVFAWGTQKEHEINDEAALLLKCQQEGPPGPAGGSLALPGWQSGQKKPASTSHALLLSESIGWLCALKVLQLPPNHFHLGVGSPASAGGSFMATNNLAAVASQPSPPKRWDLAVLVRRVELVAGEIDIIVSDPTGEMGATVDRRVAVSWPRAACEGTALLLAGVVAVRGADLPCRLLIMERNVARHFAPCDVKAEEAEALLTEARACAGR